MIIVEGPDGGGKSTLVEDILSHFPKLARHPRASEGVDGPVPNLYEWAHDDVHSWPSQPLSVYDRHPLVSEYIYGPICREGMDKRFHTTPLRRQLARRALVIVCLPPLGAVRASVSASRDMPGVTTHIDAIWHSYASLRATWPVSTGLLYYDYTVRPDMTQVLAHIHHHIASWSYQYE